ncbi:nuclear transport factor 2 family protein [Catenulispora pinisilvae]|uniref:nuclear transport factor 2 family protein n=1 Tax=Catenulispora pinisilvae TaxID=2705253 RepID=UPI001891F80D|nr:nuclear transport factor 2 family protein [Catenulispora pinisilvae]
MAHELNAEDRQAISEVLSLHGHLFDQGHLGRLGEIFTPDVVYDMSASSVNHQDTLRRHDGGWRISRRVISPQHTPLGGAHLADADADDR